MTKLCELSLKRQAYASLQTYYTLATKIDSNCKTNSNGKDYYYSKRIHYVVINAMIIISLEPLLSFCKTNSSFVCRRRFIFRVNPCNQWNIILTIYSHQRRNTFIFFVSFISIGLSRPHNDNYDPQMVHVLILCSLYAYVLSATERNTFIFIYSELCTARSKF